MGRQLATAVAALLACITPARAELFDLQQFLRGAEEAAQTPVALRGDGEVEVASPEATRRDQVALVVRPPADTFIELHQEAIKAVLLGTDAFRIKGGETKPEKFALDASLDASDFTREDLEPFRVSHYRDARISDDSGSEVMVTFFPKDSQYSLVVITFDRQKKVPLKIQYYRDTVSNLVKMQRDGDYALVGKTWRPASMTMENFKLRTHTTLTVHWREETSPRAELFDPSAMGQASVTLWPAAKP